MTLRQVLNELQAAVTEEFTEDMLLDSEIMVETEASTGTFKTLDTIREVGIHQEMRYSSLQHKQVPKDKDGKPVIRIITSMTR